MKKIVSMFAILALLAGMAVIAAATGTEHSHCLCADGKKNGCDHSAITWTAWESDDTLPQESGAYYLTQDVQLTKMYLLDGSKDVRICLNGCNIYGTNKVEEQILYVMGGAKLTISDCQESGQITGSANGGLVVKDEAPVGSSLTLYGGIVTGNHSIDHGGGIYVKYGALNLYGGIVEKNTTVEHGGGVYAHGNGCQVILDGTIIRENKAKYGAGIAQLSFSKVIVKSGQISKNEAAQLGGGIRCDEAYLDVRGGEISGNKAKEGGGIHVGGNGIPWQIDTFLLSGGTISGNSADYAGGLYMQCMKATITGGIIENNTAKQGGGVGTGTTLLSYISGLTLRNNTASEDGGGMYLHSGSQTYLSDCQFTGNQAAGNGGGLWADDELHMTDLTITGNAADGLGGGVYLATARYDGESYLSGFFLMGGDMRVTDNGKDNLYVAEGSFVNMPATGLSADAQVGVSMASDDLFRTVFGSYNYEEKGDAYMLSAGDASLSQQKVQHSQQEVPENYTLWVIIGGCAAVVMAALALLMVFKKKK